MALNAAIQGISLLPEDSWNTHHTLAFSLHLGDSPSEHILCTRSNNHDVLIFSICFTVVRALCEHFCRNSDTAVEICIELIEKRAQSVQEEVEAYILLIKIYLCLQKYKVAAHA